MAVKNGNEVRVEKVLSSSPKVVFKALAEGRLFNNCGANSETLEIDFREGGGYKCLFENAEATCCGRFLEIVQDRRLVFTWGDVGSDEGFPTTKVTVDLFSEEGGNKTKILIVHTGFKTQDEADAHDYGWNSGLEDFDAEIAQGRLRILRLYPIHRDSLSAFCSDFRRFFAPIADVKKGTVEFKVGGSYRFPTESGEILGQIEELVPGKRIVIGWLSDCDKMLSHPSRVTLAFDDEDEGGSSLAILHEGLPLGESVTKHRQGWEFLLQKIRSYF